MTTNQGVRPGDPAPDFAIPSPTGEPARLSDFRGKSEVVLFFYPKDDSPACTAEACAFRDAYEDFREAGAEVIGISADTSDSHKRFAGRRKLPYRMVSDEDGSLRKLYGVPKTFGFIPGRVTYVIDREGVVRHVFNSQFWPTRHVAEALGVLKTLRG
jgi:peroxiredoxin Q/BCP